MIKNSNILISMASDIISISNQGPYHLPMGLQWKQFAQERYYPPSPQSHLLCACNARAPPEVFHRRKAAHGAPVSTICWELHIPACFLHVQLPSIYHH